MTYGHWVCEQDFDPLEWFGFVYQITNLTNNRKYIGKKFFSSKRRKKVTGRKNRKIVIKESDWQKYTSSSDELNEDINKLGKEKFEFRIIKLCKTKRDLGYSEVKEQFKRNVLESKFDNGEREYYNQNIMSRWFVHNNEHSEKTKKKMNLIKIGVLRSGEVKRKISLTRKSLFSTGHLMHPMLGRTHSKEAKEKNRNSHLGKKYGPKPQWVIEKIRAGNKGKVPWIKGKHHSEETKRKISLTKQRKKLCATT